MPEPLRIALIDDSPDDRLLVARHLRALEPLELTEAGDPAGVQALLHGDHGSYDVLITDYQLRWSDGMEVLRASKARSPDVPVIFCTNSGNEQIAVDAMKAGADDYVIKTARTLPKLPKAVEAAVERRRIRQRLSDVESFLQSLTESVDIGVFRASREGALIDCNDAFLRLIGRPSRAEAQAVVAQLLAEGCGAEPGTGQPVHTRREITIERPDGQSIWIQLSCRALRSNGRELVDGLIEDVTVRKRLEHMLEQLNRRKDEFLVMLAHELRNPLAPLRNAARLIRTPSSSAEARDHAATIVERQVAQLSRLVDDLLDVARITRGVISLHRHEFALAQLLEHAQEAVQPIIDRKGQRLIVSPAPGDAVVVGDLMRLVQVLSNLLINASKFSAVGSSIELSADIAHRDLMMSVRDPGIGLHQDELNSIFDWFVQASPRPGVAQQGLGVGLALARHLVELHGGSVTASSNGPGQGSEFVIRLPEAVVR